jgi:hypothetical protein
MESETVSLNPPALEDSQLSVKKDSFVYVLVHAGNHKCHNQSRFFDVEDAGTAHMDPEHSWTSATLWDHSTWNGCEVYRREEASAGLQKDEILLGHPSRTL